MGRHHYESQDFVSAIAFPADGLQPGEVWTYRQLNDEFGTYGDIFIVSDNPPRHRFHYYYECPDPDRCTTKHASCFYLTSD